MKRMNQFFVVSVCLSLTLVLAACSQDESQYKAEFIKMFTEDCMAQVPPEAQLPAHEQKAGFCLCYASALAENNSRTQITRYAEGKDHDKLAADGKKYGMPCLESAQKIVPPQALPAVQASSSPATASSTAAPAAVAASQATEKAASQSNIDSK